MGIFLPILFASGLFFQVERAHERLADGPTLMRQEAPARIGCFFVVGNDVSPHSLYLDTVGLYSGEPFSSTDLEIANLRLFTLNLIGVRASVSVVDEEVKEEFKDLRITVHESYVGRLILSRRGGSSLGGSVFKRLRWR